MLSIPDRLLFLASAVIVLLVTAAPASAQKVTVTAADPASGEQDTLALVVKITGRNFANGARADFFKSGTTDPAGVTVRATKFVSATQLEATIDIATTAAPSYFDVRVTLSSGRSGKGSDLFRVVEKGGGQLACYGESYELDSVPVVLDPPADSSCQNGASGSLDCSFGANGRVTTAALSPTNLAVDLAMQSDGKPLALLWGRPPNATSGLDFYVIRYDVNGAVDATFGDGGIVRVSFTSQIDEEQAQTILVQPDDRIVVAGTIQLKKPNAYKAGVARLLPNGAPDTTFGNDGKVLLSFGSEKSHSWLRDAALQHDGRLVVAGHTESQFAVARLTSTGSLDASFGVSGRLIVPSGRLGPAGDASVAGVGFQEFGGEQYPVLVGSSPTCSSTRTVAFLRLRPNGTVDETFGPTGEGRTYVEFSGRHLSAGAITIDEMNRIVLPAYTMTSALAVVRLSTDGTLDTSFGIGGGVLYEVPGRYRISPSGVAIDHAGRIVIGGDTSVEFTVESSFLVVRLLNDGSPDSSFGGVGAASTDFDLGQGNDQARGMIVQPGGRIIVGGYATNQFIALAGYIP